MRPEMHFGHIISGTLHFIFLLWLVMGDVFSSNFEPPDYDYIEITGATEEEWKASRDLAKSTVVVAQTEVTEPTPSFDDKLEPKEPKIDKKVVEVKPEVPKIPELPKNKIEMPKEIQLVDPELSEEPEQPVLNQETQLVSPLPETSDTPSPLIADRVASSPIMPKNEDAFNDDVIDSLSQVPADQENSDFEIEEQNQSTRGATTEIITEPKKKPSGAPKKSLRPKGRPQIQTENETKDTPSEDLVDAVSSALSNIENEPENSESLDTVSNTSLNSAATTESIGNALLKQIEPCWNVDVGNQNAYVKVTVAFSLDKNGKIERNEIKLVASEGGEGSAARSAFTNAKKTIFKCQKKWDGFNLQDFEYEQWQQIVLTFNPDQMRNR
tara:strand:+ start:245 stop:1393 length:1149 start_codon:yes stop_codon:yes gene_type:complete